MSELRKYGVLLTTAKAIKFSLFKQDGLTYATSSTVTFAAGDVQISKDGGAYANIGTLPTAVGNTWYLILTAAELTASSVHISISDATATQVWLDADIVVETYGNAAAMHAFDLGTASAAQTGDSYARIGAPVGASISVDLADVPTVAEFNARTLLAASYFDANTDSVTVGTNNDKSGYVLTQTFPPNFSVMAITATTGRVDINVNNDKAGYSISGTKQTLDALNDIAASSVVSGGAINTTGGAVDRVTLTDTSTTNTDMRGTDGANTVAPDNASITAILVDTTDMQPKLGTPVVDVSADIAAVKAETASIQAETTPIKTKTDQLTFTKSNELDANTKSINSATVTGDGNATPWDGI